MMAKGDSRMAILIRPETPEIPFRSHTAPPLRKFMGMTTSAQKPQKSQKVETTHPPPQEVEIGTTATPAKGKIAMRNCIADRINAAQTPFKEPSPI
jgi:hypothetical protein